MTVIIKTIFPDNKTHMVLCVYCVFYVMFKVTFPKKTPRVPYEICANFQEEQEVFEVFLSRLIIVKCQNIYFFIF